MITLIPLAKSLIRLTPFRGSVLSVKISSIITRTRVQARMESQSSIYIKMIIFYESPGQIPSRFLRFSPRPIILRPRWRRYHQAYLTHLHSSHLYPRHRSPTINPIAAAFACASSLLFGRRPHYYYCYHYYWWGDTAAGSSCHKAWVEERNNQVMGYLGGTQWGLELVTTTSRSIDQLPLLLRTPGNQCSMAK